MVDVETGHEPRPMRTLDDEPPAERPERPASGVGNGRAVKRSSSKRAPAGVPLPHVPEDSTQQTPPDTFGTDELLWLDEPSGDPVPEPGDGSTKLPPWRRGLRG